MASAALLKAETTYFTGKSPSEATAGVSHVNVELTNRMFSRALGQIISLPAIDGANDLYLY